MIKGCIYGGEMMFLFQMQHHHKDIGVVGLEHSGWIRTRSSVAGRLGSGRHGEAAVGIGSPRMRRGCC